MYASREEWTCLRRSSPGTKDLFRRGWVPALFPELQIPDDQIPLLLAKIGKEQYINHGGLVECAMFLNIIILCPIIYLDYVWCIKYQYIHKYMKIGKRNGKRKKKRDFLATGPGGFRPSRARAGGPARPASEGWHGDDAMGAGPRASEEGGQR
jgi:hypothetical protein